MILVVYILENWDLPTLHMMHGPPTMISISCIQQHLLCSIICLLESERSFQKYHFQYNKNTQTSIKNIPKMYRDVGMAIPKAIQTRCRDANAPHTRHTKTTHVTPSVHHFFILKHPVPSHLTHYLSQDLTLKEGCRDRVTCVVFVCLVWHAHWHPYT